MERSESWLLPVHTDRERLLDMDRRLQPVRKMALGVLATALIICGPWVGWWTFLPLAFAGALFWAANSRLERVEFPEYWIFAAWAGSQVMIAMSILLAGGVLSPAMAWFAIPVVTLSTRFSLRGVIVGVVWTLILMFAIAFGADAGEVWADPPLIVGPAALVIAVGILSTALMNSDVQHRSEAVIDSLTGMLNRKALQNRFEELRQQSEVSGAPIGMVVIDIDHFKRVNDTVGHAVGDAVLRDVAYIIRKDLRAFELAYRLGGEEFLILVPGANSTEALRLAEGVREAVASARFAGGIEITISCGVSASVHGQVPGFAGLFESADAALYQAKRDGRNRADVASGADLVALPA